MASLLIQLTQFNVSIGRSQKSPIVRDQRTTPSGGDLAQDSAQLVEVHRFGKVEIEPGFLAALNVLGCAKAGERYGFNGSSSLGLGNHVVAAAVGQSDVTQDDVELF